MSQAKEIGHLLLARREELKLTLKEAENATSIRELYLASIEQGDTQRLISPIYAKGFFRQYANYLGLDGDQLLKKHPTLFDQAEEVFFDYGIGTLEMRNKGSKTIKWLPVILWTLGGVLIIALLWYVSLLF